MNGLPWYPVRRQRPAVSSQIEPAEPLPLATLLWSMKTRSHEMPRTEPGGIDLQTQHTSLWSC